MRASTLRHLTSGTVVRVAGPRVRVLLPLVFLLGVFTAIVSAQAPNPPTGLSVDETTTSDAGKASWTAVSGATAYSLELQVGTTGSVATLFPGNVTQVNFSSAPNATNCCKNGVAYRTRIKVTTSGGTSAWSDPWVTFTYNGTTTFTGTAFTLSLSLSYDYNAGALRITTSTSGGTGTLATTNCRYGSNSFPCGTGTTTLSDVSAGTITIIAVGERGTERHTVTKTINVPAEPGGPSGFGGDGSDATPSPTLDPQNLPIPTQDHSRLPAGAEARSDTPWIAFNEVSGDAISDPGVRAAAIEAIDIWGPLGVEAEVCFAASGSLLLLDAAYSPRRLVWMDSYRRADGKTCARLDRAGTLVLMPGQPNLALSPIAMPSPIATPSPITTPSRHWALTADRLDSRRPLDDCIVSASQLLNFRDRPGGRVPRLFIGGARAIARTDNWFQVEYLGRTGWVSSHFVTTSGDCD